MQQKTRGRRKKIAHKGCGLKASAKMRAQHAGGAAPEAGAAARGGSRSAAEQDSC